MKIPRFKLLHKPTKSKWLFFRNIFKWLSNELRSSQCPDRGYINLEWNTFPDNVIEALVVSTRHAETIFPLCLRSALTQPPGLMRPGRAHFISSWESLLFFKLAISIILNGGLSSREASQECVSDVVSQHLVNLFARLANDNIGYLDWTAYIPTVSRWRRPRLMYFFGVSWSRRNSSLYVCRSSPGSCAVWTFQLGSVRWWRRAISPTPMTSDTWCCGSQHFWYLQTFSLKNTFKIYMSLLPNYMNYLIQICAGRIRKPSTEGAHLPLQQHCLLLPSFESWSLASKSLLHSHTCMHTHFFSCWLSNSFDLWPAV